MTNTLTFSSAHKSITSLDDTELPPFVVLTGINGSGKTHLLEAIVQRAIKSSLRKSANDSIVLYNWNSLVPKDIDGFDMSQLYNFFNQLRNKESEVLPYIQTEAKKLGIPEDYCSTVPKAIALLDGVKLEQIFGDEHKARDVHGKLRLEIVGLAHEVKEKLLESVGNSYVKQRIAETPPLDLLRTSEGDLYGEGGILWGEVDPFQQTFGERFSVYRNLVHQNILREHYPPENSDEATYLDEEVFQMYYGEPPWDIVNSILETSGLDFRINEPTFGNFTPYEPKLTKVTTGVELKFQDLSSGEKILMSFALCLYNVKDSRQVKRFPNLLLLDEVDAPLHPSMTLSLLKTIQEVLVKGKRVSVILTTHSPSTVALAPEESLFEMDPLGPSVKKATRSRALSILTTGVPTLSVSFDGRRQVFVESRTDAQVYEKLYQRYKSDLKSERSLTFIEVGRTDESGGEVNAGCDQVKKLVNSLAGNGNARIFGLTDWDGKRKPSQRIKVLSPGIRNGIESLLFDPVLIAAMVIKENISYCRSKNLIEEQDTFRSLEEWNTDKWQRMVDTVQRHILGDCDTPCKTLEVKYLNGMSLQIRKNYLHLDDHTLEKAITDKFGFLKPKNKRVGDLMNHMCESILSEYPLLMPNDLIDTFKGLLDEEV